MTSAPIVAANEDRDARAPLQVVGDPPEVNVDVAGAAVADLLVALGRDTLWVHRRDTPRRVSEAYAELLTPQPWRLTAFPNDEGHVEPVLARSIPMWSLCEHHSLSFVGSPRGIPAGAQHRRAVEAGAGSRALLPGLSRPGAPDQTDRRPSR